MDTENLEPTIEYTDEETGELVIKELAKEYLSKGAWSTMMFLYQDRNPLPEAAGRVQAEKQVQHLEQGTGKGDHLCLKEVVRTLI